jgi:hypothetical protein
MVKGDVDSLDNTWGVFCPRRVKGTTLNKDLNKAQDNCKNYLPVWPCILSLIFAPRRSQTSNSPDWLPDKTEFPSQIKHLQQ